MKVQNEYVQIQLGNKTYTKKNMILNNYIRNVFALQIYTTPVQYSAQMTACFLKFDEPLGAINYDSVLSPSDDFDVMIIGGGTIDSYVGQNAFYNMSTRTDNSVTIKYKFSPEDLFTYNGSYYSRNDFEMFRGRKITAIAFGNARDVFAVADVSNMNIVINAGETVFVTRVDKFQSDGVCDGFEFPLHLVNSSAHYDSKEEYYTDDQQQTWMRNIITCSQLYSIGLGNKRGLMESEQVIDFSDCEIGDDYITINFSELIKVGHYPSEDLALGFYPTMDNSKYLILKYRLYRASENDELFKGYLDEYYTMSFPLDLAQYEGQTKDITFTLKVERL